MGPRSFDRLAVTMASGSSRRRVLGGIAAGLGLVVAAPVAARKGGNGKGHGRGNGGNGNAYGRNKVPVCKVVRGDEGEVVGGTVKYVPKPAVKAFVRQGGSDCSGFVVPPCQKLSCNDDATCGSVADPEQDAAACVDEGSTAGRCQAGICAAAEPTDPEGE